MEKIKYTLRFNRKNKLNKNGLAPIQIECYLNGKRKYFDTKIKVSPQNWNEKTKTIKGTPNAVNQNVLISEMVRKMENYEIERLNNGKSINLDMLHNAFNSFKNSTFSDFALAQIEKSTRKESTKTVLKTTIVHLNQFNKNLSFSDIDFDFLKSFEKHLKNKGLHHNYISQNMKNIRTFVNLAINNDLMNINQYPFRKYRITTKKTDKEFLLPIEIEQLENLKIGNKALEYTRDLFLFSIYTGLRYSDVISLEYSNIITIEGKKWLIKNQQKTGDVVKIPIQILFNGKPLNIINKNFKIGSRTLFKYISNRSVNNHLKKIIQLAGIDKKITFHNARHTTATYLLAKNVPIHIVQSILGHSKVSTTEIYTHLIDSTVIDVLQSVNF